MNERIAFLHSLQYKTAKDTTITYCAQLYKNVLGNLCIDLSDVLLPGACISRCSSSIFRGRMGIDKYDSRTLPLVYLQSSNSDQICPTPKRLELPIWLIRGLSSLTFRRSTIDPPTAYHRAQNRRAWRVLVANGNVRHRASHIRR